MQKFIGLALCLIGSAGIAAAVAGTPEVDATSAGSAIALAAAALLVYRGRRK